MTTFEIVIVCGAVCGVLMVIGGMVLLAIGAIRLEALPANASGKSEQAPLPEALGLEFKKIIKVNTHYPAITLFLIGVIFIVASAWFSKPERVEAWTIIGQIKSPDPNSVTIDVVTDKWASLHPDYDGSIQTMIFPNVNKIAAEILAPGCNPALQHVSLKVKDAKKHILELTAVSVEKVIDKPAGTQIAAVPNGVKLPPITSSGSF